MSNIQNTNFLQPTGFKLVIDRNNYPNLEYFVQSVQHSNVGISAVEQSYSRLASFPVVGDKLEFSEVTFSIILDEDMKSYTEMFDWIKRLVEKKYVSTDMNNINGPTSETDISLIILTSSNKKQKKIIYRNAFPTNLGDVGFEAASGDVTPIIVPVSFRYTYFDII